ncbi:MAG: hypothetical protein A3F84_10165 [Candidatus Handelsmanbacteria bacterium RIFCSPLOWO2_12_FULL_64_10]|uniref:Phospholipid/glycerol acyltransferase domain-containing protein n=1 Tax=Handelsmanbacteria sp. (strain RIFCSPLOWO2_12_FULL_64_10) TaxID=1817868 RepID=A0A1F6D4C4_HANXR|nr:MAG: hypothetical protein A3F84_10165 [Candidatus Handelsmanbacteria bacterium RIFCSPLOWO2_12_FULL_64_10]
MFYRVCWWIALFLTRVFFRLKVIGAERIPASGGVVLASNHCCYADPVFIGVSTRRVLHFLAKREAFDWLLFGPLIRRLNALPITRGMADLRALSSVEEALRRGGAVLMFPEGTRRKDGRLGPARSGVGFVAARMRAPVVPVYISGTARVFRSLLRRQRVVVHFGPPLRIEGFILPEGHKETYKRITDEVMKRIAEIKEGETADGKRQTAPSPPPS